MPRYCWTCSDCGQTVTVVRRMENRQLSEVCDCGMLMDRDIQAEHSSVRGDYQKPIVSVGLAFNTQDLDEHRRRYPDVELQVDGPGRTAYPVLRNLSQKRRYMKGRGYKDLNAYM